MPARVRRRGDQCADISAAQEHLTIRRADKPRERVDHGRLARTVGSDETVNLVRKDVQGNAVDRQRGAEANG